LLTPPRPDSLATRLRGLALLPAGAFLGAEFYEMLTTLLERVPPWLFESVRVLLLLGGTVGPLFAARLVLTRRGELGAAAIGWLSVVLIAAGLCLLRWLSMSVPIFG
jgi:hypothetical protein